MSVAQVIGADGGTSSDGGEVNDTSPNDPKDYGDPKSSEGSEFSSFEMPILLKIEIGRQKKNEDFLSIYVDFIKEVKIGNGNLKMSLKQNLFEDIPQIEIKGKFFGYNSDGTLNLNLGYNFKNGIGANLGINNEGKIDVGFSFTTVEVGAQLNTELIGERYSNEIEKLYMSEIGRWYDEATKNIYKNNIL